MRDLEHVCRLLAAWSGPGSSWTARTVVEATSPGSQKVGFSRAWRGGVEEQATRGVRRLHRWTREAGVICTPVREPLEEVSVALSWIGSHRADLLLAFACEDPEAWQRYRTRLRCDPVLAAHAMASLMSPAKRCRVPGNELAQSVRMRAGAYYAERRRIEGWIEAELQDAAAEFMRTLGGKSKYPENDIAIRGQKYRPMRHKRTTPWWRPDTASAVLALSGAEAVRHCRMHPAQSKLQPEEMDPAEADRVVVPIRDRRNRLRPSRQRRRERWRARSASGRVRESYPLDQGDMGWTWCRGPEFEFEPAVAEAA